MTVNTLFNQGTASALTASAPDETEGMQFTLSAPGLLTGIWFYSINPLYALPVATCIYQMTGAGTGSIVSGSENDSPSWSGIAGSGWVKNPYTGPSLAASTVYKVCVLQGASGGISYTHDYWDTGPGAGGLTSGIITAPNNAGADGGQDTYNAGATFAYPDTSFEASNYWIDVEVTYGVTHQTTASLIVTPTFNDTKLAGRKVNLAVTPRFTTTKLHGINPSLHVTPVFKVVSHATGPGQGSLPGNFTPFVSPPGWFSDSFRPFKVA